MLHDLQSTLASLHAGTNEEFLEQLADLEEERDQELVRLSLWEAYQIDRAERDYQREITLANEEYTNMTLLVRERLMGHLESQRKRLREDKTLLDIANDRLMFLSGSSGYSDVNNEASGPPNGGAPHSPGPGFIMSSERRSLRRRDNGSALEDMSGISGGEGRNGGYGSATLGTGSTGGGAGAGGKRRTPISRATGSGEDSFLSDRDALEGILFAKGRDAPTGTGRQSKPSYQAPAPLRNEDVQDDLNQLRAAIGTLRRKR